MLQLKNNTPSAASMLLLPDEHAIDTLYITVKATFDIGAPLRLSKNQPPPQETDIYWGEPGLSSIKYASDNHLGKPSTDIVMVGDAYAPRGIIVTRLDVDLSVGQLSKKVRVFGDRSWHDGQMTAPQPFKTMPMIYERAFGGVYILDGESVSTEVKNPVGRGYIGERPVSEINGLLLPNLEDPAQLVCTYTDQPTPVCFGFCAPHWQPRAAYAGSYDETWQSNQAPYLPADFDKRFFNMAHQDLIYPGFLQGGEAVKVTHMHPDGDIQFDVPRIRFSVTAEIADATIQAAMNMETLILEPNSLQMSIVWKGAVCCDKKTMKIGSVKINLLR